MIKRDRETGWKHAKLSGHKNEQCVKDMLDTDFEYGNELLNRLGLISEKIESTSIGGIHEKNVAGVLGKKTKSKTDLKIKCNSGTTVNISIKKSLGGQVYFVGANLFIETFEKQFNKQIPANVQRAIKLFWAAADDAIYIIEHYGNKLDKKSYNLQLRHRSLNATTLKQYDNDLYYAMLNWFKDNIYEITKIAFSMGAAENKNEWSDYIWYINLLGENTVDKTFCIEEICRATIKVADRETYYGDINGGTTIQLPFGFVQWHQEQLQFHHSYGKLCRLINNIQKH